MVKLVDRAYEVAFISRGESRESRFLTWKGADEALVVHHPRIKFDPSAADWRQSDFLARPARFPDFDEYGRPYGRVRRLFIPPEGRRVQVFHETLRVSSGILSGLSTFLQDTIEAARLWADEIGWDDTGYWAAQTHSEHSMGLDEEGVFEWLHGRQEGVLAYMLCTGGEIILLTVDAKTADESFEVDLYANNRFLPFGEIRRMIHRGLTRVGTFESFHEEILSIEDLQKEPPGPWPDNPAFALDPVALVKAKVDATFRQDRFYHCVALNRRFSGLPWAPLGRMSHFLATLDQGYWVDEDFDPARTYAVFRFSPLFLRTCIVLDVGLAQTTSSGSSW